MNLRLEVAEPAVPVTVAFAGELTEADIARIGTVPLGAKASPLQRITHRHHAVARLLAVGTRPGDVAIITGLSANRISVLQTDTSFQELIEFYSREVNTEFRTMQAQMAALGEDALDELRTRLETEPEKLSNNFLLDLAVKVADRTGNGPSSKSVSEVTVTLDLAARMKKAREAARFAIDGEARDITPEAAE